MSESFPKQTSWPYWWRPRPATESRQRAGLLSVLPWSVGWQISGHACRMALTDTVSITLNLLSPVYHPSSSWCGTDGMQTASHYWNRWNRNCKVRILLMLFRRPKVGWWGSVTPYRLYPSCVLSQISQLLDFLPFCTNTSFFDSECYLVPCLRYLI